MESINDLTIGISQILDKEFPNMDTCTEKIKQGFKEPCFFIKVLSSSNDKELNTRYKKGVFLDIHYFTDKEDINTDCNNVADKLYEALEYVNVDNKIYKGNRMTHEIVDGVLHFNLKFNYYVVKVVEKVPKMNKLKVEVKAIG